MAEGMKHDDGKIRMELLDPAFLFAVAEIMTFGAQKYGAYNWLGGFPFSRLFAALQRHLWAWWNGEDLDKETGKSHLAHAGCCLMMLHGMLLRQRRTRDDRPNLECLPE